MGAGRCLSAKAFELREFKRGCADWVVGSSMPIATHWATHHMASPQIIPWVLSAGLSASSKMDGVDINVIIPGELCNEVGSRQC